MWSKVVNTINLLSEYITYLFVVIMVVILAFQILTRQLFGSSFLWTADVARYLMIWVIFLGASFSFQYGGHVSINLLTEKLSIKYKKLLHLIVSILCIIFLVMLLIKGIELIGLTMTQISTNINIPMAYVYFIIPFSALLQIINIIDVTIRYWKTGGKLKEADD